MIGGEGALDALDRRILCELQRDASQSMAALAERVGSSTATCHRRYQKLRRNGQIRAIVAAVDPRLAAAALTVVIGVTLSGQRAQNQRRFRDFALAHRKVLMAWMTTGEFDYVLIAGFRDQQDLSAFIENDLQTTGVVERYRTFVSVDEVKFEPSRAI